MIVTWDHVIVTHLVLYSLSPNGHTLGGGKGSSIAFIFNKGAHDMMGMYKYL